MKKILVVDDEKSLIYSIQDGFDSHSDEFKVLTAPNGLEAVKTLEKTPVDLVVTDLRMPEMDGFELLAYISSNLPTVPVIVMSAYATPQIEEKLREMGALDILRKPLDFDVLAKCVLDGLNQGVPGGSVTGISVGSFLQLIEIEQKTSLLEMHGENGQKGHFYFKAGVLHDAVCGDLRGERAALEMLGWGRVQIRFRNLPKKKIRRKIHTKLMHLLMEASRMKDEGEDATEAGGMAEEPMPEPLGPDYEPDPLLSYEEAFDESWREDPFADDLDITGAVGREVGVEQAEEQLARTAALYAALKEMAEDIEGVLTCGVAGLDGVHIAEYNPTGVDTDAFGMKFAMVMRLVEKSVQDLQIGGFEENLVQTEEAWVLTRFLTPKYYLEIAVDRSATLGTVRLVANKYSEQLARWLA
ncbi:MAG: response regulator [Desulfatibacillaceae bacterium]